MDFVIYFDIASLIILAFLMVAIVFRKQYDSRSNRVHIIIILATIFTGIFDILASVSYFPSLALTIFNYLYFFFRTRITFSFLYYLLSLSSKFSELITKKVVWCVLAIPYLIVILILIANIFTNKMFYYGDGGTYQRGFLIYIHYACNYFYGGAAVFFIFQRRKFTSLNKFIALLFAAALQISASIIQYFSGNLLLEVLSCTCSLLILQIFVERPEDYLDYSTQIYNSNAFNKYIKERIDLKSNFNVLLVHTTNYSRLFSIFSRGNAVFLLRELSARITSTSKKIDRTAHVYYIDQGTYGIVFSNDSKSNELLNSINDLITQNISNIENITFVFEPKLCIVRYPNDFIEKDSLINFSLSFYNLVESSTNVIDITSYQKDCEVNLLFALDKILDKAIKEKSFEMYYQPIYDIKAHKFTSAEALIRLNDEQYGFISPSIFILYAERLGKMLEIGNIVLEKSFEFIGSEKFKELNLETVEINLSIKQLQDVNLLDRINSYIKKYNVNKKHINFELTETIAINGDKIVEDNIFKLAENGFALSLDDFGVGYSNIARLLNLPFKVIKIDKSIIDQLDHSDLHKVFLHLIEFVAQSNLKVIAEGIETKEKADIVSSLNVDYIQGFYYSKPIPKDKFIEFIQNK